MRYGSAFSNTNRAMAMHKWNWRQGKHDPPTPKELGESMLAYAATCETRLLISFAEWAGVREP